MYFSTIGFLLYQHIFYVCVFYFVNLNTFFGEVCWFHQTFKGPMAQEKINNHCCKQLFCTKSAHMVLYNEKSLDSGSVSFNVGVRTDIAMGTESYVCT